jgi:hypothetical protein
MKLGQNLELKATLLDDVSQGVILKFEFRGIHDHVCPHNKEMVEYLKKEVDKYKPDAILLDFLQYQYKFGNELINVILTPAINSEQESIRLCAIIAKGITKDSIQSLIDESMMQKVLNISMFKNKEKALEHIKKELSTAAKI